MPDYVLWGLIGVGGMALAFGVGWIKKVIAGNKKPTA